MYRNIPAELLRILEPIVADHGLELVDADARGGAARLRVVLDTPAGDGAVTVDQCAAVSREVSHALDVEDYLRGSCMLEVCSPGVDRTLARDVDFERAIGKAIALETDRPLGGRRKFRGRLLAFAGDQLVLEGDDGEVKIPFPWVARANAVGAKPFPAGPTRVGRAQTGRAKR